MKSSFFGKFIVQFRWIFISVFSIIFFFSENSFAQSVKRVELQTGGEPNIQVITLEGDGVLLLTKTGRTTFVVSKYDANLQLNWTREGQLQENLNYIDYYKSNREVYLLFSRSNRDTYEIIRVVSAIGVLQNISFENIRGFEISEFKVFNDIAYMAGLVKEEPVLMSVNLQKLQPRIIAGGIKGTANITSIEYKEAEDALLVSYSVKKGRSSYVILKKISPNGKILEQFTIEPDEDYGLLTGKLFTTTDGNELLLGNYGYKGYQSNGVPMSQGLYISKISEESKDPVKFHSFTDFKNFFKFMSQKQQERIERQIERKKDKGDDLKLNYRLLIHDIISKDNQYLLVAEVFYPEFRYNSNTYGSPYWGSPFGYSYMSPFMYYRYLGLNSWAWNPWLWSGTRGFNNGQVFDGFRYTHAVVAAFDKSGNLLWDNSFSFDNVKSMELKEKVKVKISDEDIRLIYSNRGKLATKIIKGNEVLESDKFIDIDTQNENDKVRDTMTDEIEYWYDNYYLAWGFQRISNKNEGSRKVFYLNKIEF